VLSRPIRSSLAAVVLPLLLVAAGCAQPSAAADPPPAAELARFYDQEPTWGPCADPGFECTRVEVPLDYEDPDGRTARIAMLRIPARGERIGSLLYNPGGPGQSGTSVLATMLAKPLAAGPIGEGFDVVGFDPRGIGASTPALDCHTDAERGDDAMFVWLRAEDWTQAQTRGLAERCAERSGGMDVLEHVGTRDAARDMDILRSVLGDDQLSFLGQSYGTRLGAVYAEEFPRAVRAMVLDAPMDPAVGTAERYTALFATFQERFDDLAAFCATDPACPLGTEPARATEEFQSIVRPLLDAPVPAMNGRTLGFDGAIEGLMAGLYTEDAYPALVQGIAELATGRGGILTALRDVYVGRGPDGSYTNWVEAFQGVNCLDEQRRTPDEETALKRAWYDAAPFLDPGRPVGETHDRCEHWPGRPTLGFPHADGIQGLAPTLTVAATGDPATPYEGGISLAESLGGSLLTVDAAQHGSVLLSGNACVDGIVADYLTTLRTPPDGARCAG
jgi:pimeloyl-ACP methyl ester carboxylesterase